MSGAPKERPILFSAPMVRAVLDGYKTQTRPIVEPQPTHIELFASQRGWLGSFGADAGSAENPHRMVLCPYGVPGDRLWVREKHSFEDAEGYEPLPGEEESATARIFYEDCGSVEPWRPAIHMPRWASRLTLEITEVRVQRLQDISEEDCRAEGASPLLMDRGLYLPSFEGLWNSINAKRGFGWEVNPWVWALTFKVVP